MSIGDILSVAAVVVGSLGGGAAIVLGFSSWIGKIWANRLMEADKARFARDLKNLEPGAAPELNLSEVPQCLTFEG